MSKPLSIKPVNVAKRLARKKVGSDEHIKETTLLAIVVKRKERMIIRAKKGNLYAQIVCQRNGFKF